MFFMIWNLLKEKLFFMIDSHDKTIVLIFYLILPFQQS